MVIITTVSANNLNSHVARKLNLREMMMMVIHENSFHYMFFPPKSVRAVFTLMIIVCINFCTCYDNEIFLYGFPVHAVVVGVVIIHVNILTDIRRHKSVCMLNLFNRIVSIKPAR
jgi:hypothetical protein